MDMEQGIIYYLDSLKRNYNTENDCNRIKTWLEARGMNFESKVQTKETPKQSNGSDCGVFTIMYATYWTDPSGSLDLSKVKQNLCEGYFRKRILLDIMNGRVD